MLVLLHLKNLFKTLPTITNTFFIAQRIACVWVFLVSFGLPQLTQAQAVPLLFKIDQFKQSYLLDSTTQILEDSLNLFTIEQTSNVDFQTKFKALSSAPPTNARSVYWLRISLHNNLPRDTEWILHVGYTNRATLYVSSPRKKNNQWQPQYSGKFVTQNQKQIKEGRHSQFGIFLPKGATRICYIKIHSIDARMPKIAPKLYSYYHWHQHIAHRNLIQGFFQGFLWLLAIYYTFVYFVMKDKLYLYYSGYIIGIAIYFLAISGLLIENIFSKAPILNEFAWYFSAQLTMIIYLQLFRKFLLTQTFTPWWDQILVWWIKARLILLPAGCITMLVSFNLTRTNWLIISSVLTDILLTILVLGQLYKHRTRFTNFFVAGMLFFMMGTGITIGWFIQDTSSPVQPHFIQIGICLQLFSYAIGLGVRFRHNEIQKRYHQKILIAELQTHQEIARQINTELENKVEKRTKEVASKNTRLEAQNKVLVTQKDRLEALNSIKAKLFSIISHDLRSPINSIQGVLHLMNSDDLSSQEVKSLSNKLNNQVQITQNLLDNLLYWSKLQMQGINVNYTKVNLFQLAENTLHLFDTSNSKKLKLHNVVQEDAYAWADANMVALIIRNLIANAVKFTPYGGSITVKVCSNDQDYLKVSINDTGVGIAADNIPLIFDQAAHFSTPGTAQEKGTGLGLMLCQEFVEKNHGKIWVESTLGEGSSFIFTLPKRPLNI
ncbi:membrane protein, putative [Microscilla marina ATCC 23134]|uniref:histidine kinase n=1 Tax=Microscilla marina ATCC 23134 TaxID=313606 RepID=A1ZZE9_MICM2|nr:membrane protein, putative [Microscilla marina ATCC 23134]